jgi:hypothetical protein
MPSHERLHVLQSIESAYYYPVPYGEFFFY